MWPAGSRGEFNFDVRPGRYRIEVVPDANSRFLRQAISEIDVYNNTKCSVSLITGFTCQVKLSTAAGGIANGVEILALGIEPSAYRATATTGEDGCCNIVLPKGKFHLGSRSPQSKAPDKPTFFIHSVSVLDVSRDEKFDLVMPELVPFEGSVADLLGQPVKSARISVAPSTVAVKDLLDELHVSAACQTDELGAFKFWLEAGTYDLSIEPDEGGRLFALHEAKLGITSATKMNFQLIEGFKLRGQVHSENTPLPQSHLRMVCVERKFEIFATTDERGQFAVGVPGGNYKIVASAHSPEAPRMVPDGPELAGLSPWSKNVIVGGDTHVSIRLRKGTRVHGTIADEAGKVRPGIKVTVFSGSDSKDDESAVPLSTTTSDGEGRYHFHLTPGTYQIAVNDDLAKSQTVMVESEPVQLDLDWHGWCQVKFEITGENGQKLPRCWVTYGPYGTGVYEFRGELQYDHDTSLPRGNILASEDGVCQLTLPSGIYFFRFMPPADGSFASKMIKQLSISTDSVRTVKLPLKTTKPKP